MSTLLKIVVFYCFSTHAYATDVTLEKIHIETDLPAVERGAETVINVCHSCHSMKYIKYRDLANFGMDKRKVDIWRGNQPLDAPLLAQMSESDALRAFGKTPPDLTLIVKARDGRANYVYSYLVGYYLTPDGILSNHVYPETKMPDILNISAAAKGPQRAETQGHARDIVSFLSWAADPHEAERIRLGYYVIAYLVVLTTLLYFVKNQIWSRLK